MADWRGHWLQVLAMCSVNVLEFALNKACSGKCKGGACKNKSSVWVLAACAGSAALFQKLPDGHLMPLSHNDSVIATFTDGLSNHLTTAFEQGDFSQLVLVGSANDISWTQASLPSSVSKQIVAEIEYPLMAGWFRSSADSSQLMQALQNIFNA